MTSINVLCLKPKPHFCAWSWAHNIRDYIHCMKFGFSFLDKAWLQLLASSYWCDNKLYVFFQLSLIIMQLRCSSNKTAEDIAYYYIEKQEDPPWVVEKFVNEFVGMFGYTILVFTALCESVKNGHISVYHLIVFIP